MMKCNLKIIRMSAIPVIALKRVYEVSSPWEGFSEKYRKELHETNLGKDFLKRHRDQEKITLVYAAKDQEHCHPVILKQYLESL
ncbi:DUF488 family protein [Chryseobacterium sp. WG23]|uniref:DUF488 domain-containing protein n=1 Tax=Chryseobacterium sp. WG23 TaxID=2926910 RepID=UPI00211E0C68|nr:DUF488 family protein [Chryseobacterium sp. WG23]MCQ9633938.1 DUF488 family protein [Chryseobacterium sp. WG23]